MTTTDSTPTPYQLTERDFTSIEPEVVTLPITAYDEDGGFVGWGHIPLDEFAAAANKLDDQWGSGIDPEDQLTVDDVAHVFFVGFELHGELRWQVCSASTPGAVAATFVHVQ